MGFILILVLVLLLLPLSLILVPVLVSTPELALVAFVLVILKVDPALFHVSR
jgi:hypothetical protein